MFNSDGIILKISKTGESDRICTLLTRDRGVIRAFAKCAERPKNKLHSSTNLFCYGRFSFFEGRDSLRISECKLQENFYNLGRDIESLSLASYFSELIIYTVMEEVESESYLRLLLNTLYFLSLGEKDKTALKSIFELRLSVILGYAPDIVACKSCGKFRSAVMYFNVKNGALYCEKCKVPGSVPCSESVVNALRHIVLSDLRSLFTLKADGETNKTLSLICEKYILNILGRTPSSLVFYKETAKQI